MTVKQCRPHFSPELQFKERWVNLAHGTTAQFFFRRDRKDFPTLFKTRPSQ